MLYEDYLSIVVISILAVIDVYDIVSNFAEKLQTYMNQFWIFNTRRGILACVAFQTIHIIHIDSAEAISIYSNNIWGPFY